MGAKGGRFADHVALLNLTCVTTVALLRLTHSATMGACTGSAPHPPDAGHGSAAVAGHGHNRFDVLVCQGCYACGLLQSPRTAPLPVQKSIRSVEVLTGIATFQGLKKMRLE